MDLSVSQILGMQRMLLEKNRDHWYPHTPEHGKDSLLWMMEEVGEIISIIKKRGERDIMCDLSLRRAFVEELTDVSMYFYDLLLCFGVTADEFSRAFTDKHTINMERDFKHEHQMYLRAED